MLNLTPGVDDFSKPSPENKNNSITTKAKGLSLVVDAPELGLYGFAVSKRLLNEVKTSIKTPNQRTKLIYELKNRKFSNEAAVAILAVAGYRAKTKSGLLSPKTIAVCYSKFSNEKGERKKRPYKKRGRKKKTTTVKAKTEKPSMPEFDSIDTDPGTVQRTPVPPYDFSKAARVADMEFARGHARKLLALIDSEIDHDLKHLIIQDLETLRSIRLEGGSNVGR